MLFKFKVLNFNIDVQNRKFCRLGPENRCKGVLGFPTQSEKICIKFISNSTYVED